MLRIPTIFLDMDGVIVDWMTSALRVHNRTDFVPEHHFFYREWGLTADEFWDKIDAEGVPFWSELEPYRNMEDIVRAVESFDKEYCICTTPSRDKASRIGKLRWIDKYLGLPPERIILTNDKPSYSGRGRVLIDDTVSNLTGFRRRGGLVVPYPQTWNQYGSIVDLDVKTGIVEYLLTAMVTHGF